MRKIAGIAVPDSTLAVQATELVRDVSSPLLFGHVMRAYLFAELLGQRRMMRYDHELLYVAAIMHDLGLTQKFEGEARFEVDGANAARQFLEQRGLAGRELQLVWDAIALHATSGIAEYKEPEVALVRWGVATDFGLGPQEVPPHLLGEILASYPAEGLKSGFKEMLCGVVRRKPRTAKGNMLADVGRKYVPGFDCGDGTAFLEGPDIGA